MARKKKKRFKIDTKNLFKKATPVQTKPTVIQGLQTTKIKPIIKTKQPKMDSFEKSFLKLSKQIKKQKRKQNHLQQIANRAVKPPKQTSRDINKIPFFSLKAKTKVQEGQTFDFAIIKNNSLSQAHRFLNDYGQEGVKSLLKWTTVKLLKEKNVNANKILNRFNKLNKKDLLTAQEIFNFNQQIRKAIKHLPIKAKSNIIPLSGLTQRRSYVKNSKVSLDNNALIEMMLRSLVRDYDFDINEEGKIEFGYEKYFLEVQNILESFSESIDLIFDKKYLAQGRYVLNSEAAQIYERVKINPNVKVKPVLIGTPKILT